MMYMNENDFDGYMMLKNNWMNSDEYVIFNSPAGRFNESHIYMPPHADEGASMGVIDLPLEN